MDSLYIYLYVYNNQHCAHGQTEFYAISYINGITAEREKEQLKKCENRKIIIKMHIIKRLKDHSIIYKIIANFHIHIRIQSNQTM